MQLDLDRLRRLVPLGTLHEKSLGTLAASAQLQHLSVGARLFSIGDQDADAIYLLAGEVVLQDSNGHHYDVQAGRERGRFALANLTPRQFDALVTSPSAQILRVDGRLLEKLVTWDQLTASETRGIEVTELDGFAESDREWMLSLLRTPAFLRLPSANLEAVLAALEELPVEPGQQIIRQGDAGDYYYLIREGRCEVSRTQADRNTVLAELGPGQNFGEEALISSSPRSADVVMLTSGRLMRLSRDVFHTLLEQPLLRQIDVKKASELIQKGAVRLDVRTEEEFRFSEIKRAINMPLYLLRIRMARLERNRTYVVYCDTGERSAAAAFLLAQQGFDVYLLKGGLSAASP